MLRNGISVIGLICLFASSSYANHEQPTFTVLKPLKALPPSLTLMNLAGEESKVCCQLCKKDGECIERWVSASACEDVKGAVVDDAMCGQ